MHGFSGQVGPTRVIVETLTGDLYIGTILWVSLNDEILVIDLDEIYHPFAAAVGNPDGLLFTFDIIHDLEVL